MIFHLMFLEPFLLITDVTTVYYVTLLMSFITQIIRIVLMSVFDAFLCFFSKRSEIIVKGI